MSGLPWYEDQGRRLLHLGFAYSHQFRNNDNLNYRSQPESFLAPILADTDDVKSDGEDLINAGAAFVHGPCSVQAEYTGSFVSASKGGRLDFGGLYVLASYFLTGEHRPFNRKWPRFVRLIPKRQFSLRGGGWGALELAVRYSHLDLDSGFVDGGVLGNVTHYIQEQLGHQKPSFTLSEYGHLLPRTRGVDVGRLDDEPATIRNQVVGGRA